jgi:hypothetical protein
MQLRDIVLAALGVAAIGAPAAAGMSITPAGAADGFSLTTFATLPSSGPYGSWGSARLSDGNIVVNGYASDGSGNTVNYVFHDADGQNPGTALFQSPWADGSYASGLTTLNGVTYGTHFSDETTRVVNSDGSEGKVIANVGRGGISADPQRGTLLEADNAGLLEVNPADGTFRVVNGCGGFCFDGVTVSPDGKTVYAEAGGEIFGLDIASGNVLFGIPLAAPDGVGVIASGTFAGDLIVNSNFGLVDLVNPTTFAVTEIANGGSRGDYVGYDPSNGSLFLSQGDSLLRLTLSGGTIGGLVPEPATWAMLILGFGFVGGRLRQRKAALAA